MRHFVGEFKKFAIRGNVIDLAVAVVIGGAFGKIVSSLVDNIIMPLAGLLIGGISFSELSVSLGKAEVTYGIFIQRIVDFLIISFAIFIAIKMINKLQDSDEEEKKVKQEKEPGEEIKLLREIRDNLKK
jgi:large conductance mechanosensitive channel